jgi:hypothetical protein
MDENGSVAASMGVAAGEFLRAAPGLLATRQGQRVPIPADFGAIAPTLHHTALSRHYGVATTTVRRWLDELAIECAPRPGTQAKFPMPTEFAEVAPRLTRRQLGERYLVGPNVIAKWCIDAKVEPKPAQYWKRAAVPALRVAPVELSVEAQAAQYLRRRLIVYKCEILPPAERANLPNKGKGLYYVNGKGAIPAADMVELAKAKGFDPDAWARI